MGYSFLIPVYNCRDTLAACVDSIRGAELSDYEILLIDDGSTDGSAALCDALAERCPEVRVFHQANAGVSAARNRGLAEAVKEHILFADGDDVVDGRGLQAVLQNRGDLMIFGLTMEHWHRGVCYQQIRCCDPYWGTLDWEQDILTLFEENLLGPVWNKVYRREILQTHGIRFREELFLYEDLEFVLRYVKHCETVVNVPCSAYGYRISGKAGQRIRRIGAISAFLRPLEAALSDLSLPRKTQDALRLRLFEILAWESCGLTDGKALCRDFQDWYETLEEQPTRPSKLVKHLLRGRGGWLKFCRRCALLRHALAVEGKTWKQKIP